MNHKASWMKFLKWKKYIGIDYMLKTNSIYAVGTLKVEEISKNIHI